MTQTKYNEIFTLAKSYESQYRLRRGQALMNALQKHDCMLFESIHGSSCDCFYEDANYPRLVELLKNSVREL